MRQLGYRVGYLTLDIDYPDRRHWDQRIALDGLCRDTLTIVRALAQLWPQREPGTPLRVGVVLTRLVGEDSATLPLFIHQQHLDVLADGMDRIDTKHGRHTVYFGGMWGAQEAAPTRISFTQIPGMDEFG